MKSLIENLRSFISGDIESFWELIFDIRIQQIISNNRYKATSIYKLTPDESNEFAQELIISMMRILKNYQNKETITDNHQENSLFRYLNFVLIGESERVVKKIKGMISYDEKGSTTIKGKRFNLDQICEKFLDSYDQERIAKVSILSKIKASLYSYLNSINRIDIYRAISLYYEDGLSWKEVSKKIPGRRDIHISQEASIIFNVFKAIASEVTQMDIEISSIGVFTSDLNVCFCYNDQREGKLIMWEKDYADEKDLVTIEGKIGDLIRQYNPTWVVFNSTKNENSPKTIIKRLIAKRSVLSDEIDLDDLISRIPNIQSLHDKKNYNVSERNAFLLSIFKNVETSIVRRKNNED